MHPICLVVSGTPFSLKTMDKNLPRKYTPYRTELASPDNDWDRAWCLARLNWIGSGWSGMTTFIWRLIHKHLPIQDRRNRTVKKRSSSTSCQLCKENTVEDLDHAFFCCTFTSSAGNLFTKCLTSTMFKSFNWTLRLNPWTSFLLSGS